MFSGSSRPEATTTSYSAYDRRPSYSGDQHQYYTYTARPQYEPPRPLEPRPTLHSSLSDTASLQRRHDSYHQVGRTADYRPPGPNLPGLRDILPPTSGGTGHGSYGSTWHSSPIVASASARPQYAAPYPHPPMVVDTQPQNPHDYRNRSSLDVSVHASSQESFQVTQPMSLSPYASYRSDHGPANSNHYERGGSNPTGAHMANGVSTPYSGPAADGSPFGGAVTAYEQNQPPGTPGSSIENQKKYLGIKEVAGEGTFHCYEGGYRIPTHVDGEHVNPAWGLTKANKPRKRLALACLDCREKKIKCEPGATSCLQCEKAKRPCRRSQAQQSQAEPGTTEWSPSGPSHVRSKASISDPTPAAAPSHEVEPDIFNKRRSREDPSPPNVPHKKHRSASPLSAMTREAPMATKNGPSRDHTTRPLPTAKGGVLSWEEDPYEIEPQVTLQLLQIYFEHFNNATYCLYPRHHFMQWLETRRDKCQNERIVLYAMLAVGSIFADESLAGFGRQCARVTLDILPQRLGNINLCTAQARTLLALYSFAKGEHAAAWEHSGAAIRAVQYLGYNTEQGCLQDSVMPMTSRCEFNFSPMQLIECRRRTFWATFFMDRYSHGTVTVLKPQDVFLRLPCAEDVYEGGLPSDAPYLNNGTIDPIKSLLTAESHIAPMAWHILVAAIWGDVVDFLYRSPYQAAANYRDIYESFYSDTWNRLQGWLSRLPDNLQYNTANLENSIQRGYSGTFISIHALYHLCCMKLNRCLRHALARDSIARNIRAAHEHGHHMLQLMCAVNALRRTADISRDRRPDAFTLTVPFTGYATLAAVDIVSAGGTDSTLSSTLDEIHGGLMCLQELSRFWSSAKDQARLCEKRYYQIQNILKNPLRAKGGAWLGRKWGLEKALESDLCADDDCIYGLGASTDAMEIYFDAFGDPSGRTKAPTGGLRLV